MITTYPLTWPTGWKRTPAHQRRSAGFSKGERRYSEDRQNSWRTYVAITVADAVARVQGELERMEIAREDTVISTNLRVRLDGLPRSDQRMPEDPGAAVYWETKAGERRCMAIDRYERVEHNLAAIAATLEAMRSIERHGGATILDRAFTGFTALAAPISEQRQWRDVLGVGSQATAQIVKDVYRRRRSESHPDKGGTEQQFRDVQSAYEQAARELGFAP